MRLVMVMYQGWIQESLKGGGALGKTGEGGKARQPPPLNHSLLDNLLQKITRTKLTIINTHALCQLGQETTPSHKPHF